MKHSRTLLLYVLTALLSVLSLQSAEAQQRQDALYIFRNDGQFNAFFYGDIERIEYSRVDTFGIKRHDYVVQEIYALDSVYRIPLSAIDSVSFVTPENKIRSDVVMPDPSIADYIVASDSVSWIRLAANTPKEMIPKEGEKISDFYESISGEDLMAAYNNRSSEKVNIGIPEFEFDYNPIEHVKIIYNHY